MEEDSLRRGAVRTAARCASRPRVVSLGQPYFPFTLTEAEFQKNLIGKTLCYAWGIDWRALDDRNGIQKWEAEGHWIEAKPSESAACRITEACDSRPTVLSVS